MQIVLLIVFTVLLEVLFVALTIAVAERRRLLAATTSGMTEALKFLSIILLMEMNQKVLTVIVLSVVVAVSNYLTIYAFDWWDRRKKKKEQSE